MGNSSQYLFLASGVKDGEGFWFLGVKNSDENILTDENLVDCHRKELIGNESAKEILSAINLNLNNLFSELERGNYFLDRPSLGISFNIPLDVLEKIFDFWLDMYKDKESWEICLGLLNIRKRVSLLSLIKSGSIKGKSKKWALVIEELHSYKPDSLGNKIKNDPMWK